MGTREGSEPVKGDRATLFAATSFHYSRKETEETSKLQNTVTAECKEPRLLKSKFSVEKDLEIISSTSECQIQYPQDPF